MDAEKQRVLGFFIEGAREHLDTIERGLLNLQAALADPEQVNELFRAAHSVKGDAAMLNLNSIHKVAHRLEDCFKLLQEQPVRVDQQIESLFLRSFDTLHELVEKLQSPQGLEDAEAQRTVQEVEPVFVQLQNYLRQQGGGSPVPPQFGSQVKVILRQMLELFRQPDDVGGRQKLQLHCDQLSKLDPGVEAWTELLDVVKRALGNAAAAYKTLAPVVIKEIKQASDAVVANRGYDISPSSSLIALAGQPKDSGATTETRSASSTVVLPDDPKAIVKLLIGTLDRKKLVQVAQLLVRYIKSV